MSGSSALGQFVREHSEVRRQIHRTLWDRGLRPGDGEYERQAETLGMPAELDLEGIALLLSLGRDGPSDIEASTNRKDDGDAA
jgi:hypothetical protein